MLDKHGSVRQNKMMRVLHLSSEKTWRGGEQQIAYLIDELRLQGVQSVIALRRGSEFETYCIKHGLAYEAAGFRNEFDLATAFKIKGMVERQGVDIVHLHTGKGHGLAVLAAHLGMKAPMVLSKRTERPVKNNLLSKYKFNYPQIRKILCVSGKIKEIIDRDLHDPSRSLTVYSGSDLAKFKFEKKRFFHDFFGLDTGIKLIGNVSAITKHKDYFTFVDTAEIVCAQIENIRFLIVGTGPMEDEVKKYVEQKGLSSKVLFTGFLNNIPEILFALDVFLITSTEEGLGTTILDAHACGIPVVATRAGGIPEIVIEGMTGTLCDIGDAQALALGVIKRLSDRNTFRAGEFIKGFTKQATAQRTLEIYQEILNSKSRLT